MYLRTTQRKNTDGTIVRYVQLAHNRRVDGVTQAEVLVNLGREDRLDRDGLRRLVTSINRYLGEVDDHDTGGDVRVEVGDALTVVGSRPMGTLTTSAGSCSSSPPSTLTSTTSTPPELLHLLHALGTRFSEARTDHNEKGVP